MEASQCVHRLSHGTFEYVRAQSPPLWWRFIALEFPVGLRMFPRNNLSANILGFSEMRGYGLAGTVRTEE